ncbi:hypothetical protein KBD34_00465 [Patescibacteria group bacterium]|nr:hypothetical protein [Patescibacteria group bacterium]
MSFSHPALELANDKTLVFTALSKKFFYFRLHIVKYVLEQNCVPLNPFTSFDYFLLDTVPRDVVRSANNTLVERVDELWVFGDISDGVLAEIKQVKAQGKPIRYFRIVQSQMIEPISSAEVVFEADVPAIHEAL